MRRKGIRVGTPTAYLVVLTTALAATSPSSSQPAVIAGTYVPAKPLERPAAAYPEKELRHHIEGWVRVSFVVAPTGKVSDAMIEDSSGNGAFDQAALAAVLNWRYEPALLNGQPIESGVRSTRMSFGFEEADGASYDFRKSYAAFSKALDSGDFATAETRLRQLEANEHINLYEEAWLWWMRYAYLDATRSPDEAAKVDALEHAVDRRGYYLEPNLLVEAARRLYLARATRLDVSSAIRIFEGLRDSDVARGSPYFKSVLAALKPSYETMKAAIGGDQLLRMTAEVSKHDYWVHELMRRSFSIYEVQGRLDALDIRCERGLKRYPSVGERNIYSVPGDWGECGVYVRGAPGTQFSFQEYPASYNPPLLPVQ